MSSAFFKWYNVSLIKRPFITNGLTTACLVGIGDAVAQSARNPEKDPVPFNWLRLGRAMVYGGLVFAPLAMRYYPLLNLISHSNPKTQAFRRMAVDQALFAPIVGIPLYYASIGLMEGKSFTQLKESFKLKYIPTVVANWSVWPIFQYINFMMVPLRYRLLAVNLMSILWNTFLSLTNAAQNNNVQVIEGPVQ